MRFLKHGAARSLVPLIALLSLGAGMAGCSGDDGKDGTDGAAGPTGGTGATGPAGPTGPAGATGATGASGSAKTEPRESCGVCHEDGSSYGVAEMHALDPQVAVGNVVITQGTTDPTDIVVTFNVKVDGVNYTALTTPARKYQFNGTLRNTIDGEVEATVPGDVSIPVTFTPGTAGNYTITLEGGFTQFGAVPSRYAFRLEGAPDTPRAMVMGDFPSSPDESLVSSAGCSGCHGTMGNGFHYGYPTDAKTCTVCHDATNTTYPRLIDIGHGVHNAHHMPGGEYVLKKTDNSRSWTYDTTYPTYMTNCSVCHTSSSGALEKVNAMPVTGEGCLSCHGSMESWDFAAAGTTFHESMDATTACQDCHKAGGVAAALTKVTDFHNGLETERVGIIFNGEDSSVTEGAKFTWQITGIVDDKTNLKISWTATYNGLAVDPCNATVAADKPGFHAVPVIEGNLSMLRSYAQGDDFVLGQSTSAPGQANAVNVTTTNTACVSNVATTTIPVDAGIAAGTRGIVALQGKPQVLTSGGSSAHWPHDTMYVRVPTPTREFIVGTGALPTAERREIADTKACQVCHVGSLYQHGNTRVDNVDMCVICHNSASSDQNNRVAMGVSAAEGYDGKVGQTYELKTMLHAIHSAGEVDVPYVVYRTRGIYAWAADKALLPNWPAVSTPTLVFGADPALPVSTQPHNFSVPTYPRALNDCAACHVKDFSSIPDQSKAVGTTLDTGGTTWRNQLDDTLQGASAASCTSCHQTTETKGHAYQNGWTPQTFENGRQTIIDTK